ncbi:MAG: serine hydrolase [Chloroflexi bacterium]|nr:serine hydrolase [Chloroflexota bacterium]
MDAFGAVRVRLPLSGGVFGGIALDEEGRTLFEADADQVFPAASVIKLPVLMALYAEAAAGRLSLAEQAPVGDPVDGSGVLRFSADLKTLSLRDHALLMISVSDNTAANRLIERIGVEAINRWMREWGCVKSVLGRRLYDFAARARGLENLMTPRETGGLLLRLLRGEVVDRATGDAVIAVLERCEDATMLKRYLGNEVRLAHKSGWIDGVRSDAGIVWGDRPVVVAGFTKELPSPDPARTLLGLLGWCAYRVGGGKVPPLPLEAGMSHDAT